MKPEDVETLQPLLSRGYVVVSDQTDAWHFGNRMIVLSRDRIRLRLILEKSSWFADVGVEAMPEQFDLSIVMRVIGLELPGDVHDSLDSLVSFLTNVAPDWELLLAPQRITETFKLLHEAAAASAKERFGYSP